MVQSEASIEIAKSATDVFAYINDFSNAQSWLESCVQLSQTSSGARSSGTKLHYVYTQGGSSKEMEGFVSKYEEGTRLSLTFEDSQFEVTFDIELSPMPNATTVKQVIGISPKGLIGKLMSRMIAAGNQRQVQNNLSRLKRQLESHA